LTKLTLTIATIALGITLMGSSAVAGNWWSSGVRGSGDIVTEERDVKPFDRIESFDACDLYIKIGSPQSVKVVVDDNIQELIETKVRGKVLHIESIENYRTRRGCRVEITVPELTQVTSSGSGDVELMDLDTERFEIKIKGSGDFFISGKTEQMSVRISGSGDGTLDGETGDLEISISGSGELNARDLQAQNAYASVSGSGSIKVNVKDELEARVSGSGDIVYYGKPEYVDTNVSGSGRIRRR